MRASIFLVLHKMEDPGPTNPTTIQDERSTSMSRKTCLHKPRKVSIRAARGDAPLLRTPATHPRDALPQSHNQSGARGRTPATHPRYAKIDPATLKALVVNE